MSLDLSSAFSSMGSSGHHIYGHGAHAIGKITEHGHVLDGMGRKVGSIEHNGTIRDRAHHVIGKIGEDGKVYNKWSSHAQMFNSGDDIIGHDGKHLGHSSGGSLGGAAMLLMLNKDR